PAEKFGEKSVGRQLSTPPQAAKQRDTALPPLATGLGSPRDRVADMPQPCTNGSPRWTGRRRPRGDCCRIAETHAAERVWLARASLSLNPVHFRQGVAVPPIRACCRGDGNGANR